MRHLPFVSTCCIAALAMLLFVVCRVAPAAELVVAPAPLPGEKVAPQSGADSSPATAEPMVAWLELRGPLADRPAPYAWVDENAAGPTLRKIVRTLNEVADNPEYLGAVLYLEGPQLSLSQVDEIAAAIASVRAAGKKVLTFAEAYDLRAYLLACAADTILLQRHGELFLWGLSVEEMYFAGLLEKVGARADFLQVGKFKGADEPLTRRGPSDPWNETFDALLDDLYGQVTQRIAAGRGLTADDVDKALADCWGMTDEQMVERKLIDQLVDRDMIDATSAAFGDDFVWDDPLHPETAPLPMDNPFALMRILLEPKRPVQRRPSLAIIHVNGPITSGESRIGGPFGVDTVGSATLIEALGQARDDEMIRGVLLRIDSPGGSALASEVVWQAIREVAAEKPVYASLAATAASGGYYIACGAQRIFASPSTLVGSIGVVGGKITLAGLYEKLGITVHRRSRGPLSDMFNSVEPFTPAQRKALGAAFNRVYEQFTDRVQSTRGDRIPDITKVAQGRIFTGRQAAANGLIDEIAGQAAALEALAAAAELPADDYDVLTLPAPMTLPEFLEQLFGGAGAQAATPVQPGDTATAPILRLAHDLLGPAVTQHAAEMMTALMLLQHEPVLTLMPAAVVVR